MEEIRNKVNESGLLNIDLAAFKPRMSIVTVDIAENLWQGLVLKEKDFRDFVKSNDWSKYENSVVSVICSVDAIVPTWAYMLIVSALQKEGVLAYAIKAEEVHKHLILENINSLEIEEYINERVIVKGCADIPSPEFAMSALVAKLQPVVKSLMYGEPCSTVPIYKAPRK